MTDSSKDNSVPPSATLPSESSDDPQNYEVEKVSCSFQDSSVELPSATSPSGSSDNPHNHQVDKASCSSQDNLVPPSATSPSESPDNPHNHQEFVSTLLDQSQATETGNIDSTNSLQNFEDKKEDIRTAFTGFYRELTYLTEGSEEENGRDDTSEYRQPVLLMIDACYDMIKKLKSIKDSRSETEGTIKRHQNLALGRNQGIDQSDFANVGMLDSVTRWTSDLESSLELLIEERDSITSELKLLGQYLEEVSPGISFATTEENIELRFVFRAVREHLTESKSRESKLQHLEKENKKIGGENLLLTKNNEFFSSELQRLAKCLQEISPDFATSEENVLEKVASAACKHLYESKHRESSVLQKLISTEGELNAVHEVCSRLEEESKKMREDHASHLNKIKLRESSSLQKVKIIETELIAVRQDLTKSKKKEDNLLKDITRLQGAKKKLQENLDGKKVSLDKTNSELSSVHCELKKLLVEVHTNSIGSKVAEFNVESLDGTLSLLSSLRDSVLCQFKVLDEIKNAVSNIQFPEEALLEEIVDKVRWVADGYSHSNALVDDLHCQMELLDEMAHLPVVPKKDIGTQTSDEEVLIDDDKATAEVSQDHVSIVPEIVEHIVNEIDHHNEESDASRHNGGVESSNEESDTSRHNGGVESSNEESDASRHNGGVEPSNGKNEAEEKRSQQQQQQVVQNSVSGTPSGSGSTHDHQPTTLHPQRAEQQTSQQPTQPQSQATYARGSEYDDNYAYHAANQGLSAAGSQHIAFDMGNNYNRVAGQHYARNPETGQHYEVTYHEIPPPPQFMVAQGAPYSTYDGYYAGLMPNVPHQRQGYPPEGHTYMPPYDGGVAPSVGQTSTAVGTTEGGRFVGVPHWNPASGYGWVRHPGMPPYRGW